MTLRMLVSVRDLPEALLAAQGGADFIDLKEPRQGALGGLPVASVAGIVASLRGRGIALPVSATIGDLGLERQAEILTRVRAVAECGVSYVKVGIPRAVQATAVLHALAGCGPAVIPVFIADQGLDQVAVRLACRLGFPGLMVDTADKAAGSLFDLIGSDQLQGFVETVRASAALVGLAGALRPQHLPALARLRPDFAGFRSAVCEGDRGGPLAAPRLQALAAELRLHRQAAIQAGQRGLHEGTGAAAPA